MASPAAVFSVTADGRAVAEALICDAAEAAELVAAGQAAGSDLAWAHSAADLSALGFRRMHGYRTLQGPARTAAEPVPGVVSLPAEQDRPELWARAFRGQWGHKTPEQWPLPDVPPGSVTLALREDDQIVGVCRVEPDGGLIDAPGLITRYRDTARYASLLTAALAAVRTQSVTVESWGDGPDRVQVCERLGLATTRYVPGWEFDLRS